MILTLVSTWTTELADEGAHFGKTVHVVGDIDGDGDLDVIATADGEDRATRAFLLTDEGEVELLADGLGGEPGATPLTPGDINGDGYADMVITNGWIDKAVIFTGSPEGLVESALIANESLEGMFASSAGSIGDINGDGYADFILADSVDTTYGFEAGTAWIFYGGDELPTEGAQFFPEEPTEHSLWGSNSAGVGDVDGDGLDDYHIGAVAYSDWDGAAYIYTADTEHKLTVEEEGGRFGSWATGGDIDADGYGDVAISAFEYEIRGAVYIYAGGPTRLTPGYMLSPEDVYIYARGITLEDLDEDGHADFLVSAVDDDDADLASVVELRYGGPSGLDESEDIDFGSRGGLSLDFGRDPDGESFLLLVGAGLDESVRFLEGCADPDSDGECGTAWVEPEDTGGGTERPVDDRQPYDPGGCGCGTGGLPAALALLPILLLRREEA